MTRYLVEIEASAVGANRAVGTLKEFGLDVEWVPPVEQRDEINVAQAVVNTVVANGGTSAFNAAKARIKERWPRIKMRVLRQLEDEQHGDDNPLDRP